MSKAGVSFERVDYIIHGKEEAYGENKIQKQQKEAGVQKTNLPKCLDISFSHVTFSYEQEKKVLMIFPSPFHRDRSLEFWEVREAGNLRLCSC